MDNKINYFRRIFMSIFLPTALEALDNARISKTIEGIKEDLQQSYDHKLRQSKKEWFELLERKERNEYKAFVFPKENREPFVMFPISTEVFVNRMQFNPDSRIEYQQKEIQTLYVTLQDFPITKVKHLAAEALAEKLIDMGMIANSFSNRRGYATFYINYIK